MKEYAFYIGDTYIWDGTVKEIAEKTGVKENTIRHWMTPAYQTRSEKYEKRKILVKLESEGEK